MGMVITITTCFFMSFSTRCGAREYLWQPSPKAYRYSAPKHLQTHDTIASMYKKVPKSQYLQPAPYLTEKNIHPKIWKVGAKDAYFALQSSF
jgi:hypothetical protein